VINFGLAAEGVQPLKILSSDIYRCISQ